jgi:hypothetical protein
MSPTTSLLIALLLGVLLWFAIGTQRNIRRGNQFLKWLQDGLPTLGPRTSMKWMGSSAVHLRISRPAQPFDEAEVVVVLEPRDLPWLWAFSRRRGRRDFLILRARLKHSPGFELEAAASEGWTARQRIATLDTEAWKHARWGTVDVAHSADAQVQEVHRLWDRLVANSGGLWRLSIRRDRPHLEVHALFPPHLGDAASTALIESFRDLAAAAIAAK